MPNRTEARPAKAVLTYATGRLPPLACSRLHSSSRKKAKEKRTLVRRPNGNTYPVESTPLSIPPTRLDTSSSSVQLLTAKASTFALTAR
jgi:hypothetical protein